MGVAAWISTQHTPGKAKRLDNHVVLLYLGSPTWAARVGALVGRPRSVQREALVAVGRRDVKGRVAVRRARDRAREVVDGRAVWESGRVRLGQYS